jgi:hypothetical protein
MSGYRPVLDFTASPVLSRFVMSAARVPVVWGAVGSGKSTGCSAKAMALSLSQLVDPRDGYRRARGAIIRNTGPELKSTTIKTWLRVFPEAACGPITYSAPITHRIEVKPKGKYGQPGFVPGLQLEVLFLALDSEDDVKKLRSLDLTWAWVNEGSEVMMAIVQMLMRRIDRYPLDRPAGIEPVGACVMIDSNATDEDNPLRQKELEAPQGWEFHHQPPAVLEVTYAGTKGAVCIEPDPVYVGQVFAHADVIKAAGRTYVVNPAAENLANLARGYYAHQLPGSQLEQIQRDLQVKFVYVQDGMPVVPEFSVQAHVGEPELIPGVALEIGGDIGGGTINPAFVIAQRPQAGVWLIHDEIVCEDVNVPEYVEALVFRLKNADYLQGAPVGRFTGDPAGNKRDEYFGTVIFEYFRRAGFDAQPAASNDVELRCKVTRAPFARMTHGGKPAIIIHRRCKVLIAALSGKWKMRKLRVSGDDRYADKPDKTHPWCDAGDSLGYLLMGGGEEKLLRGRNAPGAPATAAAERARAASFNAPVVAKLDFDIFGQQ